MMRVQDVMSAGVRSVTPGQTADAAYEVMRERRIHHLAVMQSGRLVGVVSARDLAGPRGASLRKGRVVADVMTGGVVTVTPDTPVRKVANLLRGRSIGCVVVIVANRVVGIVTVSDLLESIGRGADRPVVTGKRWTLKHRVPHKKQAQSTGVW